MSESNACSFPSPNERFGFGAVGGITDFDVAQLHAGWYVNWGPTSELTHWAGLEFMHIVRVKEGQEPSKASLTPIVESNPGATWLIGNEPDTCYGQDCRTPAEYAQIYHEWYTFLKEKDPTCQVAVGGVVQPTPLRLQYLDMILSCYQSFYGEKMPVDVWNIHNFILREEAGSWGCGIPPGINATSGRLYEVQDHDRMDIFQQQIRDFRQWMKARGEQNKPLIISEYGILIPERWDIVPYFDEERVRNFMVNTFNYMNSAADGSLGHPADGNRLVQRWAWYSLNDENFEGYNVRSNLFDPTTKAIRPLGQAFGNYTAPLVQPYVDLIPGVLSVAAEQAPFYGEPVTTTLQVEAINKGNTAISQSFTVSLWDGDPLGEGELLYTEQVNGLAGGWVNATTAPLTETMVITAPRYIYAWLDSTQAVTESCETNNFSFKTLSAELRLSSPSFAPPTSFAPPGQVTTVTLQAEIANKGWVGAKNISVSFWNGDPAGGGMLIGSAIISTLPAGATGMAQISWPNVGAGAYEIYAQADAGNNFIETNENDNIAHKTLLVASSRIFLPIIFKNY